VRPYKFVVGAVADWIAARMRAMRTNLAAVSLRMFVLLACPLVLSAVDETKLWPVLTRGIDSNLRAVSADYSRPSDTKIAPELVIWAAGSNGVVLRSPDEGKTWNRLRVEGGEKLDFRGLASFGDQVAYLMSVGENGDSRIYKTVDAGETWRLQYADQRAGFFLDGLVCREEKDCFAISDPVDGKFLLLHTEDGEHWKELPREQMPRALPKEGVFAASNSSLTLCGEEGNEIFFGTGGPAARVFHSRDGGKTWTVVETPLASGNASSGIFSLRCKDDTVVAVGGDYRNVSSDVRVAAYSLDHGATWKLAERGPLGFRSGVDVSYGGVWVAGGPTGEDISSDGGKHWKHSASLNLNAVTVLRDQTTVLAVGAGGLVAEYRQLYEIRERRPEAESPCPWCFWIAADGHLSRPQ
jgi:photosystem II stability/assembly factor-like uncharacterized protein